MADDKINFRAQILFNHLHSTTPCLPDAPPQFSSDSMRRLLDAHNIQDRDWLFNLMLHSHLFNPRSKAGKVFLQPDYNQSMEQQRQMTKKRIQFLSQHGVFDGWLTGGLDQEMRKFALMEVIGIFDHALGVKIFVHFFLWGGVVKFLGTKRHHEKWLMATEKYLISGCFAMTELGHGSNVQGVETMTMYDSETGEFVINTPCESAQKYWIGGAANDATHTVVFSQLQIDDNSLGVHAFITQLRDENGDVCPNIRIADCGHKIGLNGVDNGRIWFDNVRIPREHFLNSVADISVDGKYLSAIKDPAKRFGAFMAPLTSGRVIIALGAVYSAKTSLAIAIRYSLTRRAFSITPNGAEVLLLDYPSHQRRLLPLLAKTYAMSFVGNYLKQLYAKRTPQLTKTIHVVSSALKAVLTWHNMRTLQECSKACGGQAFKTENRIGQLKAEYDVQSTFEGDNNVLMQQVSKALLAEYAAVRRENKPFEGLGLEHMNQSSPVISSQLTDSTIRSAQFQIDMFCLRERDLLAHFANEVSKYQAQGQSKEVALTTAYQLAEDLGRAFSDRTILQTFVEAEINVTDSSLKDMLGLLRSMYVMVTLDEDTAFLRYGYLTVEAATDVRKQVLKLCAEIRPHALSLVNSFGIPDAFLGPIAFDWVAANSWSSV